MVSLVGATTATASSTTTSTVPWTAPLALTVTEGTLAAVAASDVDGNPVAGTVVNATTWHSSALSLLPGAPYQLYATVADAKGHWSTQALTATTARAVHYLHATISPDDNAVAGVGLPVIVTLDGAVTSPQARAAVIARLTVVTTPAVQGAWRWMSPNELHYRGANYWASGTKISAGADLSRLQLPDGTWGEGTHTSSWSVGRSFVSTVDNQTHLMTSRLDGTIVRVMKASLGRPGYDTYGGAHLVLEKQASLVMDSATTGHVLGDKDYYRETVLWTVRISYGGTFVHAAPWSVQDQGVRNVSHGCINLSPTDGQWYFGQVRRGDVVDVVNAALGPKRDDPGMSDWNYSFAQWKTA